MRSHAATASTAAAARRRGVWLAAAAKDWENCWSSSRMTAGSDATEHCVLHKPPVSETTGRKAGASAGGAAVGATAGGTTAGGATAATCPGADGTAGVEVCEVAIWDCEGAGGAAAAVGTADLTDVEALASGSDLVGRDAGPERAGATSSAPAE